MPEKRRQYEQEFKEGAVRIVRESGKSIAEIARDLDINAGTLGNWVARDRGEREGAQGLSTDDVAELKRLRSENAQLRMERDVLKRSVAERLSTSRSIASSAFPLRSRFSSSRSLSLNGPSPSRARRSRFTHRPSVPSFRPSSRATRAIGLPVSRTIRTAPSLNSRSKLRRLPLVL